ncbi:MAG: hypothetical protein ABIX01_03790 [Chitinophagaceae bacterium]
MNHSFTYEFIISDDVLQTDADIPPMLMQPYIENAILHGIRYRADKHGLLKIHLFTEGNMLHYIVEDNGVSRAKAQNIKKLQSKGYQSYGTAITQNRIDSYNQLHGTHASVSITDIYHPNTTDVAGTRVSLLFPI